MVTFQVNGIANVFHSVINLISYSHFSLKQKIIMAEFKPSSSF